MNITSGKRKRTQMKSKRSTKHSGDVSAEYVPPGEVMVYKHRNNLQTMFERESDVVVHDRIMAATKPYEKKPKDFVEKLDFSETMIPIPLRPAWKPGMKKEELQRNEEEMMDNYIGDIYTKYNREKLNDFEHNLEVWRQLWRVCEASDIVLILADIRHPLFHFPKSLYDYISKLNKQIILVLTKQDLVPVQNIQSWKEYFKTNYPNIEVVSVNAVIQSEAGRSNKHGKQKEYQPANLAELEELILKKCVKPEKNIVGFVGHPNVGKSTLINGLMGKCVVGTSATPGYTKRLQTIIKNSLVTYLDCPGLVFPAVNMPKALQILCGLYPLNNLREPYTAVQYLAERIPLEDVYNLTLLRPKHEIDATVTREDPLLELFESIQEEVIDLTLKWTAFGLCESYAHKHKYFNATKSLNSFKAGIEILQDVHKGDIVLYFLPDGTYKFHTTKNNSA